MPVVNQAYGNDRQGIWLEWVHLRKSSPGVLFSPGALSVRRSLKTKSALSPGVLTKSQLKAHRVNAPAMAGRSAPGEAASPGALSVRRSLGTKSVLSPGVLP